MAITVFSLKSGTRLQRKDTYFQFSTSEQFTGMYWIDGKKIYCKTVNIGSIPDNGTVNHAHGISSLSQIISSKLKWYDTEDKVWLFDQRRDNDNIKIYYKVNSSYVVLAGLGVLWASRTNNCTCTLYYTKTTG